MMGIPQALFATRQVGSEMRTGTVVAVSSTTLSVLVAGTTIQAAFVDSYTNPTPGDLVIVFRQDSTWAVIGRQAGVGPNAVVNFSFEADGDTGFTPSGWNVFNIGGAATARPLATGYAPDGQFELAVLAGAAAQDTYVYSSPIPVAPGEQWAVSAFASAIYPTSGPGVATADVSLFGLWFASAGALYPATSAADTLIASVSNVGPDALHSSVSGTVTVPGGTTFLRVATRSMSASLITVIWDIVIARRIG